MEEIFWGDVFWVRLAAVSVVCFLIFITILWLWGRRKKEDEVA